MRLRIGEVVVERPAQELERLGLEPGTTAWATFPPEAVRIVALDRDPVTRLRERVLALVRCSRPRSASRRAGRPRLERGWNVLATAEQLLAHRDRRRAGRAAEAARLLHRGAATRATTSPSCASCCARPAWRSSGRPSSTATSRTRTPTSAPASSRRSRPRPRPPTPTSSPATTSSRRARSATSRSELGMPVVDRTAIILDIFAGHANTAEGKLQVELAQLEYNLARMRGLWTHLERLGASARRRASAPGARASRRSRPTAAWRATGSPRCAQAGRGQALARGDARRARARAPAAGRARRLHERRQVDAAQRLTGARSASATGCSTRSTRRTRAAPQRAPVPADRHRRLHPQAAPPARRRVRRDAGGDARWPTSSSTSSTPRWPRTRWSRCCARSTRCSRRSAPASGRGCSCSTRPTRSTPSAARSCASRHPDGDARLGADGRGARRRSASASSRRSARRCARRPAAALRRGRPPGRAARASPASSSARTPPRACASAARVPATVAERYARFAVANGAGR